jgi:hypothetical protein
MLPKLLGDQGTNLGKLLNKMPDKNDFRDAMTQALTAAKADSRPGGAGASEPSPQPF